MKSKTFFIISKRLLDVKNDPRPEKAILRKIQFIFSDILTSNFNKFFVNTTFLTLVNLVNITLVHKKGVKTAEITIDLVFCQAHLKYRKDYYLNK